MYFTMTLESMPITAYGRLKHKTLLWINSICFDFYMLLLMEMNTICFIKNFIPAKYYKKNKNKLGSSRGLNPTLRKREASA